MAPMFLKVFVMFVIFGSSKAINIDTCEGNKNWKENGKIHSFSVEGCDELEENQVCTLKQGTDVHFVIEFTPDIPAEDFQLSISAQMKGFPIKLPFFPFNVANPSGCKKLGRHRCPLAPGTKYTYTNKIEIETFYPKMEFFIFFELRSIRREKQYGRKKEYKTCIACANVTATIVGAKPTNLYV